MRNILLLLCLAGFAASIQASTSRVHGRLAGSVELSFIHNLNSIGAASCTRDNVTLLRYNAGGYQLLGRWKTRGYSATPTRNPGAIIVAMSVVEDADDGVYQCTVADADLKTAMHPTVELLIYTDAKVIETKTPKSKEGNIVEYFYKDPVEFEYSSECSKPPVQFFLTSTSGYSVNSTSAACSPPKAGYGTSRLLTSVPVNDSMKITVSQQHPSFKQATSKTYSVMLKPICGSQPCAEGETCTGGTTVYNCSCLHGYVNSTGNTFICADALLGGRKKGGIKLGTGAIVGIAVGGVALVVIVVVVVTLILRKKKSQKAELSSEKPTQPEDKEAGKGEKETDEMLRKKQAENKDSGVEDETQNNIQKADEVKVDLKAGEVKMTPGKDETQ